MVDGFGFLALLLALTPSVDFLGLEVPDTLPSHDGQPFQVPRLFVALQIHTRH